MTEDRRTSTARYAGELIDRVLSRTVISDTEKGPLLTLAVRRLMDARKGYPAGQGYDGNGGGSGIGDPTGRLAAQPDPAAYDVAILDSALRRLRTAAEEIDSVVSRWAPRHADDRAKRDTERANEVVTECRAHRTLLRAHVPARSSTATDVAGNLSEPAHLCNTCYRWVGRHGRLPTADELTRLENGQRVKIYEQRPA